MECCKLVLEFSKPRIEQFNQYAAKLGKW